MSMPNVPDITPEIDLDREDVLTLLLASVALEEIGLGHIANAEAEKLQKVVQAQRCGRVDTCELLAVNDSVERVLSGITRMEVLLQGKMEDILRFANKTPRPCPPPCTHPCPPPCTHPCPPPCTHPCPPPEPCPTPSACTQTREPPCPPPPARQAFRLEGCGEGYTGDPCGVALLRADLRAAANFPARGMLRLTVRSAAPGGYRNLLFLAEPAGVAVSDAPPCAPQGEEPAQASLALTGEGTLYMDGASPAAAAFSLQVARKGSAFRMRVGTVLDTGHVEVLTGGFRIS